MRRDLVLGSARELGTVGIVAGLCGAYAGTLVTTSSLLARISDEGGTVGLFLGSVASVFVLIALYVAAVVIVNAVDTVVAGRLRQIALLRLLGATGPSLRRLVMRGAAVVGLVGAVLGTAVGVALTTAFRVVQVERGLLPDLAYPLTSRWILLPVLAITLTATAAGWIGARRILRVSPAAGLVDADLPPVTSRRLARARVVIALLLIAGGALLLALAAVAGESSPGGFLIAFFAAVASGTGLLVGARLVIPRLVATVGLVLGRSIPARVARRNAVADPLRTTRSTMGLVIGVTLVTTILAGMRALRVLITGTEFPDAQRAQAEEVLTTTTAVLVALVAISCLISAVGFVSTMSLTVIQRRREVGLLRALGLTTSQIRSMITLESCALAGTAVAFGIALGLVYGAVGAQSLIGGVVTGFAWGLPWAAVAVLALSGAALVLVAAVPPTRRAARISPVQALAVDR